jgi:hypothetical protein
MAFGLGFAAVAKLKSLRVPGRRRRDTLSYRNQGQ